MDWGQVAPILRFLFFQMFNLDIFVDLGLSPVVTFITVQDKSLRLPWISFITTPLSLNSKSRKKRTWEESCESDRPVQKKGVTRRNISNLPCAEVSVAVRISCVHHHRHLAGGGCRLSGRPGFPLVGEGGDLPSGKSRRGPDDNLADS